MSRIAKWKVEKTKVKVVFRLQFHATHIPQTGWDKLFISFIPADSAKATAKTTKANVRNGTCKWGDPIYETTRLLQDITTKQFEEKLYKLVVAMGSSRSSLLGEAIINLADYAVASKPSAVALPLRGCDSGTILHVTVQLLTSKTGFREFEQQRELRESGIQTTPDHNSPYESSGRKMLPSEETGIHQMEKANARVRFKEKSRELPSIGGEVGLNEDYADSAVGYDGSSNTSGSLYAEKQDTSSTHEIDSLKSTISGDLATLSQSPRPEKGDPSDHRGTSEWVHGWGSDYSADNDLAVAYEENSRLRGNLELAESSILDLKLEVSSLQSHADEIGADTQKISQQLASEIASGDHLAREISVLKLECSKLKDDLEQLTKSKVCTPVSREAIETDGNDLCQELQLRWLKGLLVMEDKIRELQNKASYGYHERDFRFLHSDFDTLLSVLQELKPGTRQSFSSLSLAPSDRENAEEIREMSLCKCEQSVSGTGFDAGLYQPELGMLPCLSIPGLISHETDSLDATNAMKGKIFELLRELDELKAERESLAKKMEQMECYYEALIQELEENQRHVLVELQSLRNEHSTCLYAVSSTQAEMDAMHQDLNKKILRLEEEKRDLDSINKELERRANGAEGALKRACLNYSIAVDQMQRDLELLSFQVSSMFETNDNLIRQAFVDPLQPSSQGFPETVLKHKLESEEFHTPKFQNHHGVNKQQLGRDILLGNLKRSLHEQLGLYHRVEEEVSEMHSVNIYMDVFSKILQETLLEAVSDVRFMQEKIDELTQQLELSTKSRDLLMQRLQTALDDVHFLNEFKATCIAKCNDMALQNQMLEANLQNFTHESCLLKQKITEWESMMIEYERNKSKYDVCAAEKTELANLLKQESVENGNFRNEISSLQEELRIFRVEFDELASVKENLQNTVNFLQSKLQNLLASYDQNFHGLSLWSESLSLDLESKDLSSVMLLVEELQHNTCEKIVQLMEEKKGLVNERDLVKVSLSTAETDILVIKQKFEHDARDIVDRLDVSDAMVQKLQSHIENIAIRFEVSSKAEEIHAQQHRELISDLDRLEVELQQITSENRGLAQEISALETVNRELERSKMTLADLADENQNLMVSLQDKTVESAMLASELETLQANLQSLNNKLCDEKSLRDKLESTVTELTSQLNEKHFQLLESDKQNSELIHLKQLVLDLELEKSNVCLLLLYREECLAKAREECYTIPALDTLLSELHEFSIAADVRLTFTRTQYEFWVEELVQQLSSSNRHLAELHKKHLDVETALNRSVASEAQYTVGNSKLLRSLSSVKSELEAAIYENRELLDTNNFMKAELEEYKKRTENMVAMYCDNESQCALEVERLKHLLASSEGHSDDLMVLKEELEVVLVLRGKLDEQHSQTRLLEGYNDEVMKLQNQCNELSQKLSEQILKTEDFKNLCVHLKELKDKADAERIKAREKREAEGPPVAMQESLRIVFIKEQYETRLQELKHQQSISKKHCEEMLWKLQDAVDEIENRKRSEASHLKRNEELGMKILELEAELQSLSDKLEKMKAYDMMKAELECSLISLECCKEEKQKLEASLQECSEEKSKILDELSLMKKLCEGSTSPMIMRKEGGGEPVKPDCIFNYKSILFPLKRTVGYLNFFRRMVSNNFIIIICQDVLVCSGVDGVSNPEFVDPENLLQNDTNQPALINGQFRPQSLMSSMDILNKELERMKNENLLHPQEDHHYDPYFPDLRSELTQLQNANEELGRIFPLFNEYSDSGNAFERVLALEIELAEALRAKKKSNIKFQSSFLKQHSDEEAIFRSFRDINELIKDMLKLKSRYGVVESELKDMHERYSQLSLQFAEVEGERQKLMMTLKNVRAFRKAQLLNRS
ncbi:LOW QUALITY PROTEIN: NT-C2 domain-containing protein, partial [Cephalotus follicularis]